MTDKNNLTDEQQRAIELLDEAKTNATEWPLLGSHSVHLMEALALAKCTAPIIVLAEPKHADNKTQVLLFDDSPNIDTQRLLRMVKERESEAFGDFSIPSISDLAADIEKAEKDMLKAVQAEKRKEHGWYRQFDKSSVFKRR
jgi:hypothetical protein